MRRGGLPRLPRLCAPHIPKCQGRLAAWSPCVPTLSGRGRAVAEESASVVSPPPLQPAMPPPFFPRPPFMLSVFSFHSPSLHCHPRVFRPPSLLNRHPPQSAVPAWKRHARRRLQSGLLRAAVSVRQQSCVPHKRVPSAQWLAAITSMPQLACNWPPRSRGSWRPPMRCSPRSGARQQRVAAVAVASRSAPPVVGPLWCPRHTPQDAAGALSRGGSGPRQLRCGQRPACAGRSVSRDRWCSVGDGRAG